MATVLSLARLEDLAADIESFDLLATGFDVRDEGWIQAIANEGDTSASESVTLKITGTSQDDLATKVQSLDDIIKKANWRKDFSERYDVWLRAKLGNETNSRQAMVIQARRSPGVQILNPVTGRNFIAKEYQLGIERTPWWEDPYPYPSTTALTAINNIGGKATLAETIRGDVNARLVKMVVTPVGAAAYNQLWIGFKSARFGNPANFVSVWPLHLGTTVLDGITDTSSAADASAFDGTKLTCTFATVPTLRSRVLIKVTDVTANIADQRGTYAVLMRAKMTASSVARARIHYGYGGPIGIFNPAYRSRQVISGADWLYYDMGDVSIPSSEVLSTYSLSNSAIVVEAERISGSGSLDMDCFVMIPVDDSAIKLSLPTGVTLDSTNILNIFQKPDERIDSFSDIGGLVSYPVDPRSRNWSLPANDGSPVLVFAAQGVTVQTKSHTADIAYQYIPRWATLRGSET